MTTISGTHTVAVTLASKNPSVVITGTVDADGLFATYAGQLYSGAIFGPSPTNFTLKNTGLIESQSTTAADAGIVLGAPGTILNTGGIRAGTGIDIFGGPGGEVRNKNQIEATLGNAIYLQGAGTVENTGLITAAKTAIVLAGGGYAYNKGTLTAAAGIAIAGAPGSYVYNTGSISAATGDGIALSAAGSVSNAGHIEAATAGIALNGGGIAYNTGVIRAGRDGISTAGGAVYNDQPGTISSQLYGVSLSGVGQVFNAGCIKAGLNGYVLPSDRYAYRPDEAVLFAAGGSFYNAKSGYISGVSGIAAKSAALTAVNEGTIDVYGLDLPNNYNPPFAGIYAGDGGTVTNAGKIEAQEANRNGTGIEIAGARGTVTNTGLISGYFTAGGIVLRDGGTVVNSGRILTAGGRPFGIRYGIGLLDGGSIVNSGYVYGVSAAGQAEVKNTGTIAGVVILSNGGTVINSKQMSGVIFSAAGILLNSGTVENVYLAAGGTVINTGAINGQYFGIDMESGGYVLNHGFIDSIETAMLAGSSGTVVNDGAISGVRGLQNPYAPTGVISTGATIINNSLIYGFEYGIKMTHGGTIFQNGSVVGQNERAVYFKPGYASRLVVSPAASFSGSVYGGGGTLELASGTQAGSINLDSFSGFSNISIDAGAAWTIGGAATLTTALSIQNNGTLLAPAGNRITIASGAITGNGTIALGAAGIALDGSVAAQKIAFTDTGETLDIGNAASFAGTIENFAPTDTIDLTGIARNLVDKIAFSHGVLTISEAFSAYTITFANPSSFAGDKFSLFKDHGETGITLQSTAKMSFLASPQPPAPQVANFTPMQAILPTRVAAAPASSISATGSWAPHWPDPSTIMPPLVTLQT